MDKNKLRDELEEELSKLNYSLVEFRVENETGNRPFVMANISFRGKTCWVWDNLPWHFGAANKMAVHAHRFFQTNKVEPGDRVKVTVKDEPIDLLVIGVDTVENRFWCHDERLPGLGHTHGPYNFDDMGVVWDRA